MPPSLADDSRRSLRWSVYLLLIALAVGNCVGRILAVNSVDYIRLETNRINAELEKRKTALRESLKQEGQSQSVLEERYQTALKEKADEFAAVERKLALQRPFLSANDRSRWCAIRALVENGKFEIDEIQAEPLWDTIDMVQHKGRDGEKHLYSSKPPLLTVIMAVPYWIVYHTTGWSLATNPYEVGRLLIIVMNVVPLIVMWLLIAALVERHAATDFARLFTMASATAGTFHTTFAIVLNNHLPAALCATVTLYAIVKIWLEERREARWFVFAGMFAALTYICELPALSLLAAVLAGLLWKFPSQGLKFGLPAALLVVGSGLGMNKVAHDSWREPYQHRSATNPDDNWYKYNYVRNGKSVPSHWTNPKGIDAGEESRAAYALHITVGHHGIFSLTPIWLLTVLGLYRGLRSGDGRVRLLAFMIAAISLTCILFYIARPQLDRNYGGMTSAFRWVFWLSPLWLWGMIPALESIASSRVTQFIAATLLALSVLSVSYPTWNPWMLPWLTNWFVHAGWSVLPK